MTTTQLYTTKLTDILLLVSSPLLRMTAVTIRISATE